MLIVWAICFVWHFILWMKWPWLPIPLSACHSPVNAEMLLSSLHTEYPHFPCQMWEYVAPGAFMNSEGLKKWSEWLLCGPLVDQQSFIVICSTECVGFMVMAEDLEAGRSLQSPSKPWIYIVRSFSHFTFREAWVTIESGCSAEGFWVNILEVLHGKVLIQCLIVVFIVLFDGPQFK